MYVTQGPQQNILTVFTALPFLPKIFQIMKVAAEPEALTSGSLRKRPKANPHYPAFRSISKNGILLLRHGY